MQQICMRKESLQAFSLDSTRDAMHSVCVQWEGAESIWSGFVTNNVQLLHELPGVTWQREKVNKFLCS